MMVIIIIIIIIRADGSCKGRVFTTVCLFFCTISQKLMSQDHQTWHRNVLRRLLETHLFRGRKVKNQGHESLQVCVGLWDRLQYYCWLHTSATLGSALATGLTLRHFPEAAAAAARHFNYTRHTELLVFPCVEHGTNRQTDGRMPDHCMPAICRKKLQAWVFPLLWELASSNYYHHWLLGCWTAAKKMQRPFPQ